MLAAAYLAITRAEETKKGNFTAESDELIPLTANEIRRLLASVLAPAHHLATLLRWSHWRRRRQHLPLQRPQRGRQPLRSLRSQPPGLGHQERGDLTRRQCPQSHTVGPDPTSDERPDQIDVTTGHLDLQITFNQKVATIPLHQFLCRGSGRRPRPGT